MPFPCALHSSCMATKALTSLAQRNLLLDPLSHSCVPLDGMLLKVTLFVHCMYAIAAVLATLGGITVNTTALCYSPCATAPPGVMIRFAGQSGDDFSISVDQPSIARAMVDAASKVCVRICQDLCVRSHHLQHPMQQLLLARM